MDDAYAYIKDHGISAWNDYPYVGKNGTCRNETKQKVDIKVIGFTKVQENELALQQALGKISKFLK